MNWNYINYFYFELKESDTKVFTTKKENKYKEETKEMKEILKEKEKGITLIALVITIALNAFAWS